MSSSDFVLPSECLFLIFWIKHVMLASDEKCREVAQHLKGLSFEPNLMWYSSIT